MLGHSKHVNNSDAKNHKGTEWTHKRTNYIPRFAFRAPNNNGIHEACEP